MTQNASYRRRSPIEAASGKGENHKSSHIYVKEMSFNSRRENSEGTKDSSRSQRAKKKSKLTGYNCLSDNSESSSYKRCRERADPYVEHFIAEQDAANNYVMYADLQDNVSIRNFRRKVQPETFRTFKVSERSERSKLPKDQNTSELPDQRVKKKDSARPSCGPNQASARSDTEVSLISRTSTEESKTYSQVYSEIYEESRARQQKAEQIGKIYTNKKSNINRSRSRERTAEWVEEHLDQHLDMPYEYTTEASDDSDNDPEPSMNDGYFTKQDYEDLIQEQLEVIARFQKQSLCGYENYISEYLVELAEALNDQDQLEDSLTGQKTHEQQFSEARERQSESKVPSIGQCSEVGSHKVDSSSKIRLVNNQSKRRAEVLQFEHCEVYVKQIDNNKDSKKTPTETVISDRTEGSLKREPSLRNYEERKSLRVTSENIKHSEANSSRTSLKCTNATKLQMSLRSRNPEVKENEEHRFLAGATEHSQANNSRISPNRAKERKAQMRLPCRNPEHNENEECQSLEETIECSEHSAANSASIGSLRHSEESSSRETSLRQSSDNELNSPQGLSSHIQEQKSQSLREEISLKHPEEHRIKSTRNKRSSESSSKEKSSLKDFEESQNPGNKRSSRNSTQEKAFFKSRRQPYNCEQSVLDTTREFEEGKSQRTIHKLKSGRASNKSYKAQHAARSVQDCDKGAEDVLDSSLDYSDENSFDDYYLSSASGSGTEALNNPVSSTRSLEQAPKAYRDRASSPIQVIFSEQSERTEMELDAMPKIEEIEADDACSGECYGVMPESVRSSKNELSKEHSQISIASEDKGVQYPSGDELELKPKKKPLKIYNLDEALLQVPSDFKGKAIVFDNEDELLDLSLSDDELLLRAKRQAAAWNDRQKAGSSNNSRCSRNSISNSSSSTFSISSYVPSVRYYRRTQPEEDDNDILDADKDTGPLTYERHVARLAERSLRAWTNYGGEGQQLKPSLDQKIAAKVQLLYNAETQIKTPQRIKKREELLRQFNQQLQLQFQLIAPSFQ